jgi:phosphohistidine phosphatase
MPTLIVVRHAKAASPPGTPDVERPLTDRGRRDAAKAGDELRAAGLVPDRVVCSPALRTRQTLDGLALNALDTPVDVESVVYDNGADAIIDLLRELPGDAEVVLIVGHNPSMHQLVLDLTGAPDQGFPTSATAVIEVDGGWRDLWPGMGRLRSLWTPRG